MFHFMNGGGGMPGGSNNHGGGGRRPKDTRLYDLLKVPPTASVEEIKKSYRQLAKEYHPDKNAADGEKFKEISAAYEILSDPRKKQIYDAAGMEGIQGGAGGGDDFAEMMGGMGGGLFDQLFGGGGGMMGGGGGGRRRPRKGESTVQPLPVSLADLYNGKTTKLQLTKKVLCSACGGVGGKAGACKSCDKCRGSGRMFITRQIAPGMIQQMAARCDGCNGEGEIINEKDKCKACAGKKTVQEQKIIEVTITPGMRDNQKIVFYGEGDQEPGVEPGDVVLVVQSKRHEVFTRKGDDLFMQKRITLNEALCGYSDTITHLDGRKLLMQTQPGEAIHPGAIRGVLGEGMPTASNTSKGNLYVIFDVEFPSNHFLGEGAEAKYKKLESLLPPRPASTTPMMNGEEAEEVSLAEFDPRRYRHAEAGGSASYSQQREMYEEDEESDDDMNGGGGGMGGAQRVQCNQS